MQDLRHVDQAPVRAADLNPNQRRRIVYGRLRQEALWRRVRTPHGYQEAQPVLLSNTQIDPRRNFREIPDEERLPHNAEIQTRQALLLARGIRVRTKVMLSYWEAENPSLQIQTQRLNTPGNHFWLSDNTAYGSLTPCHITVGYWSKIKKFVKD